MSQQRSMHRSLKNSRIYHNKNNPRKELASAGPQNPSSSYYEPHPYDVPNFMDGGNSMQRPSIPCEHSYPSMYQEPDPYPQRFQHFEYPHRDNSAEDYQRRIESLEYTVRQFENQFQKMKVTPNIPSMSNRNRPMMSSETFPENFHTPLNQRSFESAPCSHSCHSSPSRARESVHFLPMPDRFKHSQVYRRSSMDSETNNNNQKSFKKSPKEPLIPDIKRGKGKGKGQQYPKGKKQENSAKKQLQKSESLESCNDDALGKKSSPNTSNQKSFKKLPKEPLVPDIGKGKGKGQQYPKGKKQENSAKKQLQKSESLESCNDDALGKKSSPNTSKQENKKKNNRKKVANDNDLLKKDSNTREDECLNVSVLQQHEKKIEIVREEMRSSMCFEGGTFSSQETNKKNLKAFAHKERELLFQLAEYKKAQIHLEKQLKSLDKSKKEYTRERDKIVKKLNLEEKFLSRALPLYAMRTKVTETILENEVTILKGCCGSGKSSQLVQYLMETSLINNGMIVCAEPSEKQALTMTKFVAAEVDSSLGDLIGFSSEKDVHISIETNVLFMSYCELLNQFHKMKSFSVYSCIIIDEAQERTADAELLLGLLKQELRKDKSLQVVIVTTPVESTFYQAFFTNSALVEVDACLFPVQLVWSRIEDNDQLLKKSAVDMALVVHFTEEKGDILVFVASIAEAFECCNDFKTSFKEDNYLCLPLHDQQDYNQLKEIYRPSPPGKRKIIFATHCGEVMNAVSNIRYVIDTGLQKEKFLESGNKNELPVSLITQESAQRRKERAGNSIGGKCYRLYSSDDVKAMATLQPDEISLNGYLEKAIMYLITQGIDPVKFEFPSHFPEERISHAIRNLETLGAVLMNSNSTYELTELGTRMSKLPFRLQINWMLLKGLDQGMKMESIALASVSDLKQEVINVESRYNRLMPSKLSQFGQACDGIALQTLRVLKEWFELPNKEKCNWCEENFLSLKVITLIVTRMKNLCKTLESEFEMDVKFSPHLSDGNIDGISSLIDEAITKFTYL